MTDGPMRELPTLPTAEDIARAGGSKGATIVRKGRSGEQAIRDWEKEHGNIEESALERKKRKDDVGEV